MIATILRAAALVVLARIILEWIPVTYEHPLGKVRSFLRSITEPLLRPIRAIVPPVRMGAGALDLSPLILIVALQLLAGAFS